MGLSYVLLAVCVAVAAAVLSVALPRIGTPGAMTLFLRFAAVSGVLAVGSSVMYLMFGAGGGIVALLLGDVAMVLAPWLLLIAVAVLDGHDARTASTIAVASALAVSSLTASAAPATALLGKTVVLAIACAACAAFAVRVRLEPAWPSRLIAATTGFFAVYSAVRAVVGLSAGEGSGLYDAVFSFAPATVLGAVAVLLVGTAVVRLRFGPRVAGAVEPPPDGTAVVVGDWQLASTAYGPERMRALVAELRVAAAEVDAGAVDVPRGAVLSTPDAVSAVGRRLAEVYGWQPEQVALLVDGAATGPVRTQPGRGGMRRSRGPARS